MRKYYTRPCNFYYGNYAKSLIENQKALPLSGRQNIAFNQIEVFQRIKKGTVKSDFYSISEIKSLSKEQKFAVENDIKKITSKRQNIKKLKFETFISYIEKDILV